MNLSIIIPVYNVEKYLPTCLNSVCNQTKRDIEIILVDDGSTDASGNICDKWAKNDNRVCVIHKDNGGLMSAWKSGVKIASGDYVGFVDSDDWIDSDMYETLYNSAVQNDVDIVCCCLNFEYPNGQSHLEKIDFSPKRFSHSEIIKSIYPILLYNSKTHHRGVSPNRVTKLYRRSLLNSIICYCDDDISIGEDLLTTFSYMTRAKSIMFLSDYHPYHYRINPNSMIQKYAQEKYQRIRMLKTCLERVNTNSIYDFTKQINADHIQLMLAQLDCEMLYSGSNHKELRKRLELFYGDKSFQSALSICGIKGLSPKNKLYINLLKFHLYDLLIFIRNMCNPDNRRNK